MMYALIGLTILALLFMGAFIDGGTYGPDRSDDTWQRPADRYPRRHHDE